MTTHIADKGPKSIRVYADSDRPQLIATIRLPDQQGSADDVLRAYGWQRVTPWATADDVPDGHVRAVVEPT